MTEEVHLRISRFLLSAALPLVLISAASAAPRYTVVPLQSLPGSMTDPSALCIPVALNSQGEAAGMAGDHGPVLAVRWDALGHIHILGTQADDLTQVQGINDTGQIIAESHFAAADSSARLFLVSGRLVTPFAALPGFSLPAGQQTMGFDGGAAINNAGEIAFNAESKGGLPQGYLYDGNTTVNVGHLPLLSYQAADSNVQVFALNNLGMAAGSNEVHAKPQDPDTDHAFLWQKGTMTDLGVLPSYDTSAATELNDHAQVIGTMQTHAESQSSESMDEVHGFVWQRGKMTNLGVLPGCVYTKPTGINAQGQIVGDTYRLRIDHNLPSSGTGISIEGGAINGAVFLWKNGVMTDLQTLAPAGWELQNALAINNQGEILCTGYHAGMPSAALGSGAFILRPLP